MSGQKISPTQANVAFMCPGRITCDESEKNKVANQYDSRVLVDNWFEERRQYHQDIPRCTGHSIQRTDYQRHCTSDYKKDKCLPPKEYEIRSKIGGVGPRFLRNDEDYCEYMQNYTTTYDLMHNWEIRRAGCKEKPRRRWKLIHGGLWVPEADNAVSFGNLTQFSFRRAPQLPMVPNDWQTYQTDTTYRRHYIPRIYPDDYVQNRCASLKNIRQGTEDASLVPKPGICDRCRFNVFCDPCACDCECHLDGNAPRFPTLVPQHTLKSYLPNQDLYPSGMHTPDITLKRFTPSPVAYPIADTTCPDPCDNTELCNKLEENMRFQYGKSIPIDSPLPT